MILQKIGNGLKKNTKTKIWWAKLGISLVLSNIFFFILFSGPEEVLRPSTPEGWVEVQLNAELLTPFHRGKRVLLFHRPGGKKIEGLLQSPGTEDQGKLTILVKDTEAHTLFQYESWEVLPYLKHLDFAVAKKEYAHEIRY